MRIVLAQLDPTVGDVDGNASALLSAYRSAVDAGAQLVCAGELGLTGYPPDDLLLRPAFLRAVETALHGLAAQIGEVPLVVGFVEDVGEDGTSLGHDAVFSEIDLSRPLTNAAAVLRAGAVERVYRKHRIPNYGVFDEARYFHAGSDLVVCEVDGVRVGVTVCEDLWGQDGPVPESAAGGAELVLNLNASPYRRGKREQREHWAAHHARAAGVWLAYCNLVGGQDEVVFDGDSFVMSPEGDVVARGAQFATDLVVADLPLGAGGSDGRAVPGGVGTADPRLEPVAEVYEALILAIRDYVGKNGFTTAVVALSGGIDSALTTVIAVDAIGPEAVRCVAMPSPYSSPESLTDARDLARNLGVDVLTLSITPAMEAFAEALRDPFAGTEPGVAEENLQSRIRGTLLMALSNKFGDLVLTTGNKSEYAVGYATLYGDMAGGFAVIKDVYKTLVYELCRYRNDVWRDTWRGPKGLVVPEAILDKPPSAELRLGQRDTDSLPPYEVLDSILVEYVERARSIEDIVADGYDAATVERIARLVDRAEYKRRQAAPGPKVTPRAFGRDRRVPITNAWRGAGDASSPREGT